MRNVLILDDDLDFVSWLSGVLVVAGYQPWPACTVADAITILGSKPIVPLHVLIVNPLLPGASYLIASYSRFQSGLNVMALGALKETPPPVIKAKAWRKKPTPGDRSAPLKWVRAIERISNRDDDIANGRLRSSIGDVLTRMIDSVSNGIERKGYLLSRGFPGGVSNGVSHRPHNALP